MRSPCETCGSSDYVAQRYVAPHDGTAPYWQCSECSKIQVWNPDVFFDKSKGSEQTDPNLVDRRTGPMKFSSKREKAVVMRQLGLREAGDKDGGARNTDIWKHKNKPTKFFFT